MKIIAAIPAHNEEATIGSVVLRAKKYVDKVIVVDDGSTDDTAEIAELAGSEVVKHKKNKGYGAAIKSCFGTARKAGADVMVIMDADWQHNPGEIEMVIKPVKKGEADIVIGSRFLEETYIPAYRKFGMRVLNLFTHISSDRVSDTQSGFRAYSRKAISELKLESESMGIGSEILMKAKNKNLIIKEVPIKTRHDIKGTSSMNPVSHGFSVISTIIRFISIQHPLLFYGFPGAVAVIAGLILGGKTMNMFNIQRELPVGIALMTVLFIIVGMVLSSMGIILYSMIGIIERSKEKE
ncbi:hypothetical protein BEH94_07755 [Candidatus Altiarchaeales archaeon WOR_SM1_SCG]|nr:hypothetical protein BEH94_07755 [Candidatus Altiarchaeales archaeon WOR_SM1_SCG]